MRAARTRGAPVRSAKKSTEIPGEESEESEEPAKPPPTKPCKIYKSSREPSKKKIYLYKCRHRVCDKAYTKSGNLNRHGIRESLAGRRGHGG